MKISPRAALAIAAVAVAVTAGSSSLVACGSQQASIRTTCSEPGVSDHEIRLGLLYSASGDAASLIRPFRAGVDARLGVANAQGGVNDRKVTYEWADDASDTASNLAGARNLVAGRNVFGLLEASTAASGSADYLHRQAVPVVGTSLDGPWGTDRNMFSYSLLVARGPSISTWGDFVARQGGHTAVLATTQFSPTSVTFAAELSASLRAAGIRVVDTIEVAGPIDAASVGRRIRATGADVLVGAVTGLSFGQVIAGARGEGAKLKVILSPTGYDQTILRLFGRAFAGVYLFVDFLPFELNTPAHRAFLAAAETYAPQVQPPDTQAALAGWISADMALHGLRVAGRCPSRQGFITGLRAVRGYTAEGLLPSPVDFGADFGQISRCYTFLQVSADGKRFVPIQPAPRCGTKLD